MGKNNTNNTKDKILEIGLKVSRSTKSNVVPSTDVSLRLSFNRFNIKTVM